MWIEVALAVLTFGAFGAFGGCGAAPADEQGVCPRIVPRDEWGARIPKGVVEMLNPVSTVVIHHTYSPAYCATSDTCQEAMRSMQKFHQDDRLWDDIGYSFGVGGDGRVYKGRGWNRVGAHSPPYNFDSIGITLIGDWTAEAPPKEMLDAAKWLIRCGVETGRISQDYQLIGHRQARDTTCPGDAMFAVLKTWPRWTDKPAPPRQHSAHQHDLPAEYLSSDAPPALPAMKATLLPLAPVAVVGTYDPSTPVAGRDAVEVRQLNKRSLWDRLVQIWQLEAIRKARQESLSAGDS